MIRVNLPSTSTKARGVKRKLAVDYVDDFSEGDKSSDSEDDVMIDYWAKNLQISRGHSDEESSNESAVENEFDASEGSLKADKSGPEALIFPDSSMFVGMIVIVNYEGELFPGRILEFVGSEVRVLCMQKSSSKRSTWKWPRTPDVTDYPHCDVKFKNICLNEVQGSSRNSTFHVAELDDVWGRHLRSLQCTGRCTGRHGRCRNINRRKC